jgi:hypothetical protein
MWQATNMKQPTLIQFMCQLAKDSWAKERVDDDDDDDKEEEGFKEMRRGGWHSHTPIYSSKDRKCIVRWAYKKELINTTPI